MRILNPFATHFYPVLITETKYVLKLMPIHVLSIHVYEGKNIYRNLHFLQRVRTLYTQITPSELFDLFEP